MKSTVGDSLLAFVIAGTAALFAAVVGFFIALLLCAELLTGEMKEWGLILAPTTALLFAVAAFVFVFQKLK